MKALGFFFPFPSCLTKIKAVAQSKAADGISFLLFYFTFISGVAGDAVLLQKAAYCHFYLCET